MKKASKNRGLSRRTFLKAGVLFGGSVIVTGSPIIALGQNRKPVPEISVLYYVVHPEQENLVKLVIQDWKKLGPEFKLNVAADPVALNKMFADRDYGHIGFISWGPNAEWVGPAFHLEEQLHSAKTAPGSRNFGYYQNPEYDRYCDLQMAEMDRNKRREYVWKCQEIAANDYPVWWMAWGGNIQAYNSRDWEGIAPMPGGGIGTMFTAWTFLKIKPKTNRTKIRAANYSELLGTNVFAVSNAPVIDGIYWRENVGPDAMVSALIAEEVDILGGDIRASQARQLTDTSISRL